MNPFSIFVTATTTAMIMMIYERLCVTKMDKMNYQALTVISTFIWWGICDIFFYSTASKEMAWLWHRLTAFGHTGFVIFAANYYFVMTDFYKKVKLPVKIIYFAIAGTLMVLFGFNSPFAEDLVLSKSGLGWTFVQTWSTPWPYLYVLYGTIYLGTALTVLAKWSKNAPNDLVKKFGFGLFGLVIFSMGGGLTSVYIVPLGGYLPPLPFIPLFIFCIVWWHRLKKFDFSYVQEALDNGYIYENCIGAMIITDKNNKILYANKEAKSISENENLVGVNILDLFKKQSVKYLENALNSNQNMQQTEFVLFNDTPIMCSLYKTKGKGVNVDIFVFYINDISMLKQATNKLEYLANFDELTGLSNRRMVMNHLFDMEKLYNETGKDFELLFLDLTKFKYINDNFGHEAGDKALCAVADTLKKHTPQTDLIARFAGDEFLIVHIGDEEDEIADKIRNAIRSIDTSDFAPGFTMNAGIGTCRYSEAKDIEELIRIADDRMYKDK